MADTTFVDGVTLVPASWLNDVNDAVYTTIPSLPTATVVQNSTSTTLSSVSGTDTILGVLTPTLTSYSNGQTFRFTAVATNTGAVTINIDGLGAKAITKTGATPLVAGDIAIGAVVQITYDGTQFQLVSGAGGSSSSQGAVNLLTQATGVTVPALSGQSLVGPITIPVGQAITVPAGSRLVIL